MGELFDKAKGKLKEAAGALTGDRKLEAEGKADKAKGDIKGKFEDAKRAVKDTVDSNTPRRDEP
ncbi:CsbD family protein [Corallococcus sp. H22C18031201]|nr:CsbD family protein [Corallococcus sp. H22C18031201]